MGKKAVWPVATLGITALVAALYFALSGGAAYVTPLSRLYPLGVSGYNLVGSVTYTFVHIGLKHLVGNLAALVVFGAILEQRLRGQHVFGMFVLAGIGSGLAYALINPGVWVVGASAAVAGLLVASLVTDTRLGLAALVAVMLLVPNVVLPATDMALDSLERQRLLEAEQAQAGLYELQSSGENQTETGLAEQEALEQQYGKAVESRKTVVEGRGTEAATPASLEIHAIGGMLALAFMWVFDRAVYTEFLARVRRGWRWVAGPYKS